MAKLYEQAAEDSWWQIVLRSGAIWCVLIAAEIVHGILRAVALVPWLGAFRSNQLGVFSGLAIILAIACWSIRWIGAIRRSTLLLVGAIWLVLTLIFELLFGRFVLQMSWSRLMADYNLLAGGLMPLGLLGLFLSPLLAARLRGKTRCSGEQPRSQR